MHENALNLAVKITKKKYADMLCEGKLLIRSLGEYNGLAGPIKEPWFQTSQGDLMDGASYIVKDIQNDPIFGEFDEDLQKIIQKAWYLDTAESMCKVYCMYALTYLLDEQTFLTPSRKLRELGDTAVIIGIHPFTERIKESIAALYGVSPLVRIGKVQYYPLDYCGGLTIFGKSKNYSWQQEIRIALTVRDGSRPLVRNGQVVYPMIEDYRPLQLDLGDLSDICYQIPLEDLLNLRLPLQFYEALPVGASALLGRSGLLQVGGNTIHEFHNG